MLPQYNVMLLLTPIRAVGKLNAIYFNSFVLLQPLQEGPGFSLKIDIYVQVHFKHIQISVSKHH